ncbi:hypothetical protein GOBAR_AA35131 [Gossypium barbadense]|uniref:Pectinesterase n=1 Tax=Gossypium barbadense TaxID=3634 RepID=A0A2P5W370_GOSBA|nr:hypothetical protein GOBAR_AA35131 [Gossypium barbadense]
MANNAIIGICTVFLVAMVVAVVVGVTHIKSKNDGEKISSSNKAVQALCQPTNYKETCQKSLASSNSSDVKELMRTGFQAGLVEIKNVLDLAIDDFQKSFDMLGEYDMSKIGKYLLELKTWLSGAFTSQQTCIDSFAQSSNESSQKMQSILKTSMEITSNALAMLNGLSTIVKELNIPNVGNVDSTGFNRKLFSAEDMLEWISQADRKLLQAKPMDLKPNVVVAKDGSGKYDTINKALAEVPVKSPYRFVIHIKAGTYKEKINVTKQMTNVIFIGDGPTKTVITNDISVAKNPPVRTYRTATVGVDGAGFMAKDIGFDNSAGPEGHQAVAFRATADRVIMFNCHFTGYQDTLYAHRERQLYTNCLITGTVDFIFGDAASIFQNCMLIVRKPGPGQNCMVTAQERNDLGTNSAIVLQNCTISGAPDYIQVKDTNKAYLGRPWKQFARSIIMQSQIDDIIQPEGYAPMTGTIGIDTSFIAEFGNRGPDADTSRRVAWKGIKKIDINEANKWTPRVYLESETWVPSSGIPYSPDMVLGV